MSAHAISLLRPAKLQMFIWRYPEWWAIALSGLAWLLMLQENWRHFGHGVHHAMSFPEEVAGWLFMIAAMMLPLNRYSLRAVANASLWARRHRAIAGFLAGFSAPWLALGLLVALLRQASWSGTYYAAAVGFAAAALWQRTALHRRALMRCHSLEAIAPFGWRADRDCLRYGSLIGLGCVATCWPLMIACALTGHSLVAMGGGMLVGISERCYYRPRTLRMLVLTLALAFYYVVVAGLGSNIAIAAAAPPPEIVASTDAPFALDGKGETRVMLAMHWRSGAQPGRVFLNIEKILSDSASGPYSIYLNLPPNQKPTEHPELNAGELTMFGLLEANRADGKAKPEGLYQQLEITKLFAYLQSLPGWEPKRLSLTFVPRYLANTKIQVSRVTVSNTAR